MVEPPQVKGGLKAHVGLGWKITQVAKVLDKRSRSGVSQDIVDPCRVGAVGNSIPVLNTPVRGQEVIGSALGDVGPPVLKHV